MSNLPSDNDQAGFTSVPATQAAAPNKLRGMLSAAFKQAAKFAKASAKQLPAVVVGAGAGGLVRLGAHALLGGTVLSTAGSVVIGAMATGAVAGVASKYVVHYSKQGAKLAANKLFNKNYALEKANHRKMITWGLIGGATGGLIGAELLPMTGLSHWKPVEHISHTLKHVFNPAASPKGAGAAVQAIHHDVKTPDLSLHHDADTADLAKPAKPAAPHHTGHHHAGHAAHKHAAHPHVNGAHAHPAHAHAARHAMPAAHHAPAAAADAPDLADPSRNGVAATDDGGNLDRLVNQIINSDPQTPIRPHFHGATSHGAAPQPAAAAVDLKPVTVDPTPVGPGIYADEVPSADQVQVGGPMDTSVPQAKPLRSIDLRKCSFTFDGLRNAIHCAGDVLKKGDTITLVRPRILGR